MSIIALNWAWRQRVGCPTRKIILQRLADSADQTGYCWPSSTSLALYCEVNERTVQRNIRQLVASDLITVTARFVQSGRQTSNGYQLHLWKTEDANSPPSLNLSPQASHSVHPMGDNKKPIVDDTCVTQTTKEPSNESSTSPLVEVDLLIWPNLLTIEARQSFIKQSSALSIETKQELLDELGWQLKGGLVRNPTGYLRAITNKALKDQFVPEFALLEREHRNRAASHNLPRLEIIPAATPFSEESRKKLKKLATELREKSRLTAISTRNDAGGDHE